MKKLLTTKTFWAGAAAAVTAAGAYCMGEISLAETIQAVTTGLVGICLRHGMITSAGDGK
jgi:hypothetical protein